MSDTVTLTKIRDRYFMPDYVFRLHGLYWNTGGGYTTTQCLNAHGDYNFSNSTGQQIDLEYYIGSGKPNETGISAPMTAAAIVGLPIGSVTNNSIRSQTSNVEIIEAASCTRYSRKWKVNDGSLGYVWSRGTAEVVGYGWYCDEIYQVQPIGDSYMRSSCKATPNDTDIDFLGWYVDGAKVTSTSSSSNVYLSSSDPNTLYVAYAYRNDVEAIAVFAAKFTVKFDANGGSGSMSDQSFTNGVSKSLTLNRFSGPTPWHVFDGWNTAADGSGTARSDGADGSDLSQTPGGTVTLYAQWRFVGFSVSVSFSGGFGTLSIVRVSDNAVMASASASSSFLRPLVYTGAAGVAYKITCTMSDGYVAPPGVQGLANDTFVPAEGDELSYSYSTSAYTLTLPSADEFGNVLSIASPTTVDAISPLGTPAYAKGRNIVVTASCADEWSLTAAYLDDSQGYNQASYTGDQIAGGSFTLRNMQQNYVVRATFGEKHYTVTAEADAPSSAALTVSASASYVVKDTSVTFTATAAEGFVFEGWYLDGEKVSSSAEYTRSIDADTALVAKAKVSVSLDVMGAAASLEVDGEEYTPATEFYIVLGDSFSYALIVTASDKYFNGWFEKPYDPSTSVPLVGYGDTKTVTPTAALDIVALIGDIDPTEPVQATFAYASGSDSTMGTFSVDGVPGPQTKTLEYIEQVAPSVALEARTKNGYVFTGWFSTASAQGDPITVGADGVLSIAYSRTIYARFDKNTHSICEWEGSTVPKALVWRTKTYEASKPFNPSACRVDALGYAGDERDTLLELTVDMYSAPDVKARATATTTLRNIANQDARRLPVRRMERYMQIEVKANAEVDTLLVGTSMEGLAQ